MTKMEVKLTFTDCLFASRVDCGRMLYADEGLFHRTKQGDICIPNHIVKDYFTNHALDEMGWWRSLRRFMVSRLISIRPKYLIIRPGDDSCVCKKYVPPNDVEYIGPGASVEFTIKSIWRNRWVWQIVSSLDKGMEFGLDSGYSISHFQWSGVATQKYGFVSYRGGV